MSQNRNDLVTYDAFCRTCDDEKAVMRTVPWQDDVCLECGSNVEDGDRADRSATRQ